MTTYIHELRDRPKFGWVHEHLASRLSAARHLQGRLIGQMEVLGFKVREEAVLRTLTDDVLKSSEIEGEKLNVDQVRSSVARRLGMDMGALKPAYIEGVVEMMLDATRRYDQPLTNERLFGWHAALFPTGRSGMHTIKVGEWRGDSVAPMQVVSGPVGRERIHFEAPAAARLEEEMGRFLEWFNGEMRTEPVLKAAQAHLWFGTIHPFDDGNGRITRGIADMALARSEGSSQRFYSMSAQIREERGDYYRILAQTQRGTMDVTLWMEWFLGCLTRAIEGAQVALSSVIAKARYWKKLREGATKRLSAVGDQSTAVGLRGQLTFSSSSAAACSCAYRLAAEALLIGQCHWTR
jgi:Fic family protein